MHRLLDRDDVGRVVAVDAERGDAHGATWRVLDVRDPALVGRLRGVHTVAHLALDWGVTPTRRSGAASTCAAPRRS